MLFYKRRGAAERPRVTDAAVGAAELTEARVSAVISTAAPALAFTAIDVTAAAAIATTALAVAAAVTATAPGTHVRQNTWHASFRTATVACAHALSNEGNTCFANGILQILMACQAFEDALTSHASQACL